MNDTLGHSHGDSLLISVSDTLKRHCPDKGYVSRIGGDEFVMLIPNCDSDEAVQIIESINSDLSRISTVNTKASIALGHSTKRDVSENINQLINLADINMYSEKNQTR